MGFATWHGIAGAATIVGLWPRSLSSIKQVAPRKPSGLRGPPGMARRLLPRPRHSLPPTERPRRLRPHPSKPSPSSTPSKKPTPPSGSPKANPAASSPSTTAPFTPCETFSRSQPHRCCRKTTGTYLRRFPRRKCLNFLTETAGCEPACPATRLFGNSFLSVEEHHKLGSSFVGD